MANVVALLRLSCVAVGLACAASAHGKEEVAAAVSPLEPIADKKFFGKDYPTDERPKVDKLHFKHPYPVVQDSGDFDRDYVKDENSDDGSWKAQTEYDRLRQQVAKEKKDVAEALRRKTHREEDLRDAMRRSDVAREQRAKRGRVQSNAGEKLKKKKEEDPIAGGAVSPGEIRVATEDTKKAMDELEACKQELAEARNRLKQLTDDLDGAKKEQGETAAIVEVDEAKVAAAEAREKAAEKVVKSEFETYSGSRKAFLAQQAKVAQMEIDLQVAAAKVKQLRGDVDEDGGVYPTKQAKSAADVPRSLSIAVVLVAALASACALQ